MSAGNKTQSLLEFTRNLEQSRTVDIITECIATAKTILFVQTVQSWGQGEDRHK